MRVGRQTLQKVAKAVAPRNSGPSRVLQALSCRREVRPTLPPRVLFTAPTRRPPGQFTCRGSRAGTRRGRSARPACPAGASAASRARRALGTRKPSFILPEASVRSTADTAARKSGGRPPSAARANRNLLSMAGLARHELTIQNEPVDAERWAGRHGASQRSPAPARPRNGHQEWLGWNGDGGAPALRPNVLRSGSSGGVRRRPDQLGVQGGDKNDTESGPRNETAERRHRKAPF